ncbi:MAG: hypothetical protein ACOY4O_20505 [Pseudomonadota bacterium]
MTSNQLEGLGFESGVLRHADGSIDIAAYGRIAHEERLAAMHEAVRDLYKAVLGWTPGFERRSAPKPTLSSSAC